MTGYKATNADLTCTPNGERFQFEIGKWYEIDGDIELCRRGFHFCVHPSGVWNYYSSPNVRVFKIEAEQVLECPIEAGADFKLVAKRIRLVEEITPGMKDGDRNTGDRNTGNSNTGDSNTGNSNTGDRNTGDRNTGNWNTGNRNTGNWNTGDRNTGNSNTGNWNTGNSNTGDSNTGDSNTGDRNTGNWNTGNWNTGDRNTGNWNTGDRNTGNWNTSSYSAGMFCAVEPKVISFDVQTDLTRQEYFEKFPEVCRLGELLSEKEPIAFSLFKNIPGITKKKLTTLHAKHLEAKTKLTK